LAKNKLIFLRRNMRYYLQSDVKKNKLYFFIKLFG